MANENDKTKMFEMIENAKLRKDFLRFKYKTAIRANESGEKILFYDIAYQNESNIESEATNLVSHIEAAIQELERTRNYIKEGALGCINSIGILQSTNNDIDRCACKLHMLEKYRPAYECLFEEKNAE